MTNPQNIERKIQGTCSLNELPDKGETLNKNLARFASKECIDLILKLSFNREEAGQLLKYLKGLENPDSLQVSVIYGSLAELVRKDAKAAQFVGRKLNTRLETKNRHLQSTAIFEIASIWAKEKESMDGLSAAALLWTLARSSAPSCRVLESVIVEDLNYLAARALSRPKSSAPISLEIPSAGVSRA